MDHRRGLQRLYAVLTVAWIGGALLIVPSERFKLQSIERPPEVEAFVKRYGEEGLWKPPRGYENYKVDPPPNVPPAECSQRRDAAIAAQERAEQAGPRFRSATVLWLFGVLVLPPGLGYVLLFHVARWVYRGFSPGTHT